MTSQLAQVRVQEWYYTEGNKAYCAGQFDRASELYSGGIDIESDLRDPALTLKLMLNRSQCGMQLRNYEVTIADCSAVLKFDVHNHKALFRRASAYENTGALNKAFNDIASFIKFPPSKQGNNLGFAVKEYGR